jgi:hypothetical protein
MVFPIGTGTAVPVPVLQYRYLYISIGTYSTGTAVLVPAAGAAGRVSGITLSLDLPFFLVVENSCIDPTDYFARLNGPIQLYNSCYTTKMEYNPIVPKRIRSVRLGHGGTYANDIRHRGGGGRVGSTGLWKPRKT